MAGKRFQVAGGTLPSAEEMPVRQDAVTPIRQEAPAPERLDAHTPGLPGARTSGPAGRPARSAFTWRLTAQQAVTMDDVVNRLKLQLDRPGLDRAQMLSALVGLAAENPATFGALAMRLAQQA